MCVCVCVCVCVYFFLQKKVFHSNPTILHYKNKQNNGVMAPGHVFTIEPMINEGDCGNVMWRDDWTATTKDGKRSAQFEHTVSKKQKIKKR